MPNMRPTKGRKPSRSRFFTMSSTPATLAAAAPAIDRQNNTVTTQ